MAGNEECLMQSQGRIWQRFGVYNQLVSEDTPALVVSACKGGSLDEMIKFLMILS